MSSKFLPSQFLRFTRQHSLATKPDTCLCTRPILLGLTCCLGTREQNIIFANPLQQKSGELARGRLGARLDSTTNIRGLAKRNAAFTLHHGAMLNSRQPEGCVPVVVSSW